MSASEPRVGVVTVTYNASADLPDFLHSISTQAGVNVTLYAVDSASTDTSVDLLKSIPIAPAKLELIESRRNVGIARGNNLGIERALADGVDWVILANNDTTFGTSMVADLIAAAKEGRFSLLSPVIEGINPPGMLWFGGARMIRWQGFRVSHVGEGAVPARSRVTRDPAEVTDFAPACCLLVAPAVFERIGLMDASYFVYYDDVDFAVRARAAGYQFGVTSRARLLHKAGSATGGAWSDFSIGWLSRNAALLARRHLRKRELPLALAYMQVRHVAGELRHNRSWRTYAVRQRWFWKGMTENVRNHELPLEVLERWEA